MELQQIKGRLRELFPKANLSSTRILQYVERLKAKLSEESTEEDVDVMIKDLNDLVDFEQVAKDDDRIRTYKPKEKEEEKQEEKKEEVETTKDDTPEWAKALMNEVKTLREEKVKDSIQSKFKSDKRLQGIPDIIVDKFTPSSFDDIETTIESLVDTFKDAEIKAKIDSFGKDIPKQGEQSKSVEVKQASDAEIDEVFKNIAK